MCITGIEFFFFFFPASQVLSGSSKICALRTPGEGELCSDTKQYVVGDGDLGIISI